MSRGHGEGQKGRPNNYKLEEEIDALSMESSLNGEGQDKTPQRLPHWE